MRRFRRRDDALGLGEENACGEGLGLRQRLRFDESVFEQLADDRPRAVVTQSARVDVRRLEIVPAYTSAAGA